jgi:hypothetical protein
MYKTSDLHSGTRKLRPDVFENLVVRTKCGRTPRFSEIPRPEILPFSEIPRPEILPFSEIP